MNRRSFLRMLGLAPVAAVVPVALAPPAPARPQVAYIGERGPELSGLPFGNAVIENAMRRAAAEGAQKGYEMVWRDLPRMLPRAAASSQARRY